MTTNAFLHSDKSSTALSRVAELDRVRLARNVVGPEGSFSEGSTGTIVHVHRDGAAYEVEITAPVHAIVTVVAADVERLNG